MDRPFALTFDHVFAQLKNVQKDTLQRLEMPLFIGKFSVTKTPIMTKKNIVVPSDRKKSIIEAAAVSVAMDNLPVCFAQKTGFHHLAKS